MVKGIAPLTPTLVIDPLNEMALKPVAPNSTVDIGDENPDRYPSLLNPLSGIQQGSRSTTENTNARHIRTLVDGPGSTVTDKRIPDTPAIPTGSDHPGDTLMEDVIQRDSTSGDIQTVNEGGDCRIDSNVGN